MCGIAGLIYTESDREINPQILENMSQSMRHRGPDDWRMMLDGRAGLVFNRLSIVDIAHGSQPLPNEDETLWLVFNGEIYNYLSLRGMLEQKGHQFRSSSDSETILHLFEEYGENCVHHLQGMFSFAIWDRQQKQLFAAVDPFGIKPFYYYADRSQFAFASEIKSLLALEAITPMVDPQSLLDYLTFQYVPKDRTMFDGIRKLEPGTRLKMSASGMISLNVYWQPAFEPENRPLGTFVEELRHALRRSVQDHLQGEAEIGCFLSGGLDSSSITSFVSERGRTKTFSVGFEGERNENVHASDTAKLFNSDHFQEMITPEQFFEDTARAVWHMDEPVSDPAAIPTYRLSKLASSQVKVVLSGEGADEMFAGYGIYREPSALRPVSWLPRPVKSGIRKMLSQSDVSFYGKNYLTRGTTPLEERFKGNASIFNTAEKVTLLQNHPEYKGLKVSHTHVTDPIYSRSSSLDDVSRMQLIDLQLWLPGDILPVADKMSMAHSLELRVPFLDKKVFDIARKIPHAYRLNGKNTKHPLREAMKGIVPDQVLSRPKLGFPVPLRHWIIGKWGEIMLEQMEASSACEWIRMEDARSLLTAHRQGKGDYSRKLWTLYIFALWCDTFISSRSDHATLT